MSVQAMAWVFDHSKSTGNDRLVLLAIANHASKDGGGSYPSVPTIASEARVSDRTVTRSLKRLAALGELRIVTGGGVGHGQHKTNLYALPALSTGVTGCHPAEVTDRASRGDTAGQSGVTPVADKPTTNRTTNRACGDCGGLGVVELADGSCVDCECKYRKKKRRSA